MSLALVLVLFTGKITMSSVTGLRSVAAIWSGQKLIQTRYAGLCDGINQVQRALCREPCAESLVRRGTCWDTGVKVCKSCEGYCFHLP